jgi:hypothetical protein
VRVQSVVPVSSPPRTITVALSDFNWPLDPALAATRDETTLARAIYSTPLRTDSSGRVVSGLCSAWQAANGFRTWTFRCLHALEIAAELRRVGRTAASPAHWIFSLARSATVPSPGVLVVSLRTAWRRFPYALTAVAAAPRGVPGPFRVVSGSRARVVLRANGRTLVFVRLSAVAAEHAFLHGEVDEAPVPLGDVGRFRDSRALHVQPLLALDAVLLRTSIPLSVRRAYWQTADRADYQALVAENGASAALGILAADGRPDPAAFRRAVHSIPDLPPLPVRITVPDDSVLRYGAHILYAQWRELGLGPVLVAPAAHAAASFIRARPVYPQTEALLAALRLAPDLADADQRAAFTHVDAAVRASASVIPVCWVADARFVSPRLAGWREDVLGDVDYEAIR